VTGLAKGALFRIVTRTLESNRHIVVASTKAEIYFPLDHEIEPVLAASTSRNAYALVEKLSSIWSGESGPYSFR
jgi:hypothetical protein